MVQIAIIGAGPYGLSLAAHLRSRGVAFRIFGKPLDTWSEHMPAGMSLKSDGFASSLSDPEDRGSLRAYCAAHGLPYHDTDLPVSLEIFNAYAADFQQRFVPELEVCEVVSLERKDDGFRLELDTGEALFADIVVNAVGISYFASVPAEIAGLPPELATHSSAHRDLSGFAGRDVTVLGAGSSAVDIATLLHEAGAHVSLVARADSVKFSGPTDGPRSRWQRLRHPSTGIGPGLRSWLFQHFPHLFRFLPDALRLKIIRTHLGPKSPWHMKARFEAGVQAHVGEKLVEAVPEGGRLRLVFRSADGRRREAVTDHLIAATGYYPKVPAVAYLSDDLRGAVRTHVGMPVLSSHFESSVPGLYFVGPAAVNTFGPLMRFMVGAEYAAPRLARQLAGDSARRERAPGRARP